VCSGAERGATYVVGTTCRKYWYATNAVVAVALSREGVEGEEEGTRRTIVRDL
jgi:hypothetical protein